MSRRRVVQLVSFLAALGLFFWLLAQIGFDEVGRTLVHVGWMGALVIGALGLAESIPDGVALAIALGDRRRALGVVAFNSVGGILNQLLPFDLGEVAKVSLMHRYHPGGGAISGTIVWNYVFKISRPLITLVAAVIGVVWYSEAPLEFRQVVLLATVVGFVPYVVFRLVLRRGGAVFVARVINWARRAPLLSRLPIPPSGQLLTAAAQIDEAARTFWHRRPRSFVAILVLQSLARSASWASLAAALTFVGRTPTFAQAALLYAALNSAEFLITVLPARLGVAEFAAFGVFKLCGLDPALGVITYVVLRLKALATNGVMAPLAFVAAGAPPHAAAGEASSLPPKAASIASRENS